MKIISALVCLLALGVFAGCGGDDETKTVTQPAAAPATTPATTTAAEPPPAEAMPEPSAMPEPPDDAGGAGEDYPPGFGDKFAEGCASSGRLTEEQCKCWFDRLSEQYTYQEFIEVLQQVQGGDVPAPVQEALRQCL